MYIRLPRQKIQLTEHDKFQVGSRRLADAIVCDTSVVPAVLRRHSPYGVVVGGGQQEVVPHPSYRSDRRRSDDRAA